MSFASARLSRTATLAVAGLLLATGLMAVEPPAPAVADTLPIAGVPATVSADPLPTVQIDGVVWNEALVGNTVYAGGQFASARPAGSPAGVNTVTRNNLLSFDVTTGVLNSGWAPNPNGQVLAVTASPDGSRVYVGGSFTSISGVTRNRIAAYDTATGALITSFNAGTNSQVRAIAATDTTVYVGGIFSSAGNQPRAELAAFDAATGALLPWAPTVDDGRVNALAVSPDGATVIAGGNFTSVNGTTDSSRGMARLDATTGAKLPFPANAIIWYAGGDNGALLALSGDEDYMYGTGYTFGRTAGTLEGIFAADWDTGEIAWVLDCHGDTYDVFPQGDVIYSASHHHYCGNVRSHAQTEPDWTFYRANAVTKAVTQTVQREHLGYTNFAGQPGPSVLNWRPRLDVGTFTGQTQGPWSVTGDERYIVMGGEFPTVNNVAQQGLVRFAVSALAPNDEGPRYSGASFPVSARAAGTGAVRVSWRSNADFDNADLTYRVFRNGDTTNPVWTGSFRNEDWDRAWMGFTDTGLTPGQTYTYQVRALDPYGNYANSSTVQVVADGTGTQSDYANAVMASGASYYWRLGDAAGTSVRDTAAANDAVTGTSITKGVQGAILGDPDTAYRTTNSSQSRMAASTLEQGRITFSIEAWFKASGTGGNGPILNFGNRAASTQTSTARDRVLYMDSAGRIQFGVWVGVARTVRSPLAYNNGQWHHTVATLGADGMKLYVDGVLVDSRTDTTTARNFAGYWRLGDSISIYPNVSTNTAFNGSLDEIAVYPTVLTPETIAAHYALATTGTAPNLVPTASFTAATTYLDASVDGSASSDPDGTIASYAWDFGDGATGTGQTATHTYATAGTYTVSLTVTDDDGATGTTTGQVVTVDPPVNQVPVAAFTSSVASLAVSVDGSASSDPDGTIASYAWDFGDGATGTGQTATHTYATAGTYTVSLTVTDDDGATGTTTGQVVTVDPPAGVLAQDDFARTVANGWGTADVGGPWTTSGAASLFAVTGGAGRHTLNAGATAGSFLTGVSATDTEVQVTVSADRVPSATTFLTVQGRRVGTDAYAARLRLAADSSVQLHVTRGNGTPVAGGVVTGLTFAAGDQLQVRLQVEGTSPTTVRAKVWKVGTTEPATWNATMTDNTIAALQTAGGLGLQSYTGGVTANPAVVFSYDNLWAGPLGGSPGGPVDPPVNQVPVAAFTSSVASLAVSVDGSASSDPDGTIASYAWDFGDGATGTGQTATHTYATAGTYTVSLTVTDDDGATGTTTGQVVTVDPPAGVLAQDDFARTVANGWGTADVGGPWTTSGAASLFAVTGGAGRHTLNAGATAGSFLTGVSATDTEVQVTVSADRVPSATTFLTVQGRRVGTDAYAARLRLAADSSVQLHVTRGNGTPVAGGVVTGLTFAAGDQLQVRLQVEGTSPTTVRAKVWKVGTTEPATWNATMTDNTIAALQTAGGLGLQSYTGGVTANPAVVFSYDNLWAGPLG
ncbi:PKD domain-containing protein [Cellulomonas sp. KRMCY2]|uniref:PKD domain-containing protein n=1 Tax=Cellulomonas sp. KRMCY2 TaxID=1304865 RepID=UPI00045E6AAE|nr:PKD domain-containing protein [Cellulomonas sp. KRMCY2]